MMKTPNSLLRKAVLLGVAGFSWGMSANVLASGFALIEDSGSGLGNAYAGGAASAEDAGTIFYNPAGLTRLDSRQLVVVAHAIRPEVSFSDQGSSNLGGRPVGDNGGEMRDVILVPNFYYAMEINPALRFGLGINAPFGLKTDYSPSWAGRYQAVKSELKTLNINPALAYKVNDSLSIGGGINYQKIDAELTSVVPGAEMLGKVSGDDDAWGYNLGVLYQASPQTRLGASYRSRIGYRLEGNFSVATTSLPVTADLTVPDSASLSVFHQINPAWDVMADLTWTGWSSFDRLRVVRTNGAELSNINESWRDTLRTSVGVNYHHSKDLTYRAGVAFDQTPVRDEYRTARIPDSDRTWLSFGVKFAVSPKAALDLGYAHIFMKDATINKVEPFSTLKGSYSNSVDILSVQYTHSF